MTGIRILIAVSAFLNGALGFLVWRDRVWPWWRQRQARRAAHAAVEAEQKAFCRWARENPTANQVHFHLPAAHDSWYGLCGVNGRLNLTLDRQRVTCARCLETDTLFCPTCGAATHATPEQVARRDQDLVRFRAWHSATGA